MAPVAPQAGLDLPLSCKREGARWQFYRRGRVRSVECASGFLNVRSSRGLCLPLAKLDALPDRLVEGRPLAGNVNEGGPQRASRLLIQWRRRLHDIRPAPLERCR